ncbi:DUF1232 domain-containing protein [Sporosarcina sp. resist]|uniref:DUF1232 domain-containing protein n=1 Tax=Sporosarcina sp. resist TaxID=2762563 RepID=UPI002102E62D|nr:DUF1232 domain-containing protein [Sporosarcina sp. resist]
MGKLSELTGIDKATISRIINGKRNANIHHLQKFSNCLEVPLAELMEAAGYDIENKQKEKENDPLPNPDSIQDFLASFIMYDRKSFEKNIKQELLNYEKVVQTEEGHEVILKGFADKLKKLESEGPYINQLKHLFQRFRMKTGTVSEITIIGSALLYFIMPIDLIPDYMFPIGYLDDAVAVKFVINILYPKI